MSKFSEETAIDPKKYRFVPRIVADPRNKQKIYKSLTLRPETHKRIHKLSCKLGISFCDALEKLIDTEEARAMAPLEVSTWIDTVKSKELGYAGYDLFGSNRRKKRHNGNTKGISGKVQGDNT